MKILSIETSCDDTCISIMEVRPARNGRGKRDITNATFRVLANNSNSQIKIHIPYGGVYPVLAKREHKKNLPIILEASLREAKLNLDNKSVDPVKVRGSLRALAASNGIDAIAVTYGPGLEMCLWEGIIFAQDLAKKWKVPLIPVNHMEGHILSVFGKEKGKFGIRQAAGVFPALALLVSGGHTQLVLIKKFGDYEIIGETLDDAVGEAFDKVARMLDLPYPGGPQISALAEFARKNADRAQTSAEKIKNASQVGQRNSALSQRESARELNIKLPRPMLHSKNFDFSFSGLKTAVLYLIRDLKKEHSNVLQNTVIRQQIALEFENAAIECLVYKTQKAMEKYKIKTLIVAGGVAANKHLKNEMQKITKGKVKLLFPTKELATDNSIMIGIAGYLNYMKNKKKVLKPNNIKATGNLRL